LEECQAVVLAYLLAVDPMRVMRLCEIASGFFIIGTQLQIFVKILVRAGRVWMGFHDDFVIGALEIFE
jgi:hypothetical protein